MCVVMRQQVACLVDVGFRRLCIKTLTGFGIVVPKCIT